MKKINMKSFYQQSLLIILMVLAVSVKSFGQVPNHQDCRDAIPICGTLYTETNSYVGQGAYTNEVNSAISTCTPLFTELNSCWYIFTCQTNGPFGFLLTPTNPAADFNWAVYNQSGTFTCANIYTNPALAVACNTDPTPGPTGMCGGAGPQFGSQVGATAGQTYVICISDVNATGGGFTLDFSCSTSQIPDNVPPHMSSITAPIACNATTIKVRMSEEVTCATGTNPANYYITDNALGVHTITGVTATNCTIGGVYDNYFTLTGITPALTWAGQYYLHITGGVTDLCGNVAAVGQLPFNIAGVTVQARHTSAGCTCVGRDSIRVLTGLGGFSYLWSPSGSTSATITGLCAGAIYTCTVHGSSGCPGIVIDTIPSGSTFSLTTWDSSTSCIANTGQAAATPVNGVGPYTYVWSPNVGTSTTVSNLWSGTYNVTVTDQGTGCTATAAIIVSTGGGMSAAAHATNVNCNNALNGTIWCTVIGAGVYHYSWSPSAATTNSVTHRGPGNYTVTVTDSATGCTVTSTCTIGVVTALSVSASSNSVCCASAINGVVWATITGNTTSPFYTYHWSPSNATTATVSSLTVSTYNVTVTDTNGCTATANTTIAVTASMANAPFSMNPTCSSLGWVQANGGGCSLISYSYHWSNGSSLQTLNGLGAGTYTVTITDTPSGCTLTASYTLTLTSNVTLTMHNTNVHCNGAATGTAWATVNFGNGNGYLYAWTPSGGTSATASNLTAGTYTLSFTQSGGCSAVGYVTITEPPPIYLSTHSLSSSCSQSNGSAYVVVDSGGIVPYTYHWNTSPVQTTDTAHNIPSGTYYVTVTDSNGCRAVDSATILMTGGPSISVTGHTDVSCFGGNNGTATSAATAGTSPYTYSWNSVPVQNTQNASTLPAGHFTVTVTDATGCTATDTVSLTQPAAVYVIVAGAVTQCVGDTTIITASASGGTPGYTYLWTPGGAGASIAVAPLVTTTYICVASDTNNCPSAPQSVTITVLPPITVTAFGPSDTICAGRKVSLTATATGGNNGPYTYLWSPGGMTGNPVTVQPSITTTYTCTVNDGCTRVPGTTVVAVEVVPVPLVNFNIQPKVGCDPLVVTFTNVSLNVKDGSTYNWDFGGLGSDTAKNPTFTFRGSGFFDVKLKIISPEGCSTTLIDTNAIHVLPKPIAVITADPLITTKSNANVSFYNYTVGDDIWDWNFGDSRNSTAATRNTSFRYLDTGKFTANLVATNDYGCTDTAYVNIYIKDDFSFFIPNAFSPDNDGVNDYFSPTGINVVNYVMYIYDRYGNEIFTTTDLSVPWDGNNSAGNKVPEDVYTYWILISDNEDNRSQFTGRVTLIR